MKKEILGNIFGWGFCFVLVFLVVYSFIPLGKQKDFYYGYVYAFPNLKNSKNYYVKAKIYPSSECDIDSDDRTHCQNTTIIKRIYFKNGDSLVFEECEGFNKKGKFFECYADDGKTWNFKYLGEKVKTEEIPTQGQDFN